jgi:hypothetical protein
MSSKKSAALPSDNADWSPLIYDSDWARPTKKKDAGSRITHGIGFLFLLPFVVMLVIHEYRGMSDALLMGDDPRDEFARGFNLLMGVVLYLGSFAFLIYTLALPIVTGRGWRWVVPKIIFLAFYWGAVIAVMSLVSLRNRA